MDDSRVMGFQIGKKAGCYEFVDCQVNPRIGVAYKVRNSLADRFELLRVLPAELKADREEVERFMREIKVHARLTHPNIVTFYTATELENELVTPSEFVDGATLEKRLEAGPMPWREAAACLSQVLAALGCAHQQGIVHREV